MNILILSESLKGSGIIVSEFIENNKASEKYVRTTFVQDDGFSWPTVVLTLTGVRAWGLTRKKRLPTTCCP